MADSLIMSLSQGGSQTISTLALRTPGTAAAFMRSNALRTICPAMRSWSATSGEAWLLEPEETKLAAYGEVAVGIADNSRTTHVTAEIVETGVGTTDADYKDKDVKGKLVLVSGHPAPAMREAGYGRIVNISSINGLRGNFGQANYSAAKAGLIGLTKTMARELGPRGVTVNVVAPGMVLTEMTHALPEEIIARAKAECILPEMVKPEDIANAVLFLLSDAARMITGEVLRVSAGKYI